jgi:hypothetical protein
MGERAPLGKLACAIAVGHCDIWLTALGASENQTSRYISYTFTSKLDLTDVHLPAVYLPLSLPSAATIKDGNTSSTQWLFLSACQL